MNSSNIINFFHDCYKADHQGTDLWNIFSNNSEYHFFFNDQEVLQTGSNSKVSLNSKIALATEKQAYLYRREKNIIYCSFFIIGTLSSLTNKAQNICAPLLYYPAKIIRENSNYFLTINLEERQINTELISKLINNDNLLSDFHENIFHKLSYQPIDSNNIEILIDIFKTYLPQVNTTSLYEYPLLLSKKELNEKLNFYYQYNNNFYKIFPASALALVNKSRETRGILFELSELTKKTDLSKPLQIIFANEKNNDYQDSTKTIGHVPAVLSNSQQNILKSTITNPITLVIGPPGTGKSYTIASIALEHLSCGKSILIASKMTHTVDVIGNLIEDQLGISGSVINGCKKDYLKKFTSYLEEFLFRTIKNKYIDVNHYNNLKKRITILDQKIQDLEKEFDRRNIDEIKWGDFLAKTNFGKSGLISQIKRKVIDWKINSKIPHSKLIEMLEQALAERISTIIELIRVSNQNQIKSTLLNHRDELNIFLDALKTKLEGTLEKLFDKIDFNIILKLFPIWLVNLCDIFDVLPLKNSLFDLAIIDEATQCDIASCIPVLQRAKKIIIVGDPKQLRHSSFLSKDQQDLFADKYNLTFYERQKYNYHDKSILDLVNEVIISRQNIMFLDEHYRSIPQILNFSNQEFYNNSLKIMNKTPNIDEKKYIECKYCKGKQNKNGKNYSEALFVVDDIIKLIEDEKNLNHDLCHSIGVLCPFKEQIDYIFELLSEKINISALEKHDILVGTAHTFQGEERDVMFISFVVDSDSSINAFFYLNKPDIFNVSITRARSIQHVYTSIKPEEIKQNTLFKRYLENISNIKEIKSNNTKYADNFLQDVKKELNTLGIKIFPAYSVAGIKIDLVIEYSGNTYGLDLLGYPGLFNPSFSADKYKMYHRAGLKIFPITYSNWYLKKEKLINEIKKLIGLYNQSGV